MKKTSLLFLLLIFILSLCAQNEDTSSLEPRNTRFSTIDETFQLDSITGSPLLKALEGIGTDKVKEAYKQSRMAVDSTLSADSLNPNFWRIYSYQAVQIFVQANKSSSMAMSIFLPMFLLVFFIVLTVLFIKTFLIHPRLMAPVKPDNDPNISKDSTDTSDLPDSDGGETSPENE